MMPSWATHRVIGELICGFHAHQIDRLVDQTFGHDASRYDADILIEVVESVYADYGEKGLCYFVLHHYLDRLADILVGEAAEAYERRILMGARSDYAEIKEAVSRRLVCDPKNLLTLFIVDDPKKVSLALRVFYDRKKRRRIKAWEDKLQAAYSKLAKYERKEIVRLAIKRVLEGIYEHLDYVIYLVLIDVIADKPATVSKIVNCIWMKIASYTYHRGLKMSTSVEKTKLIDDVVEFIEFLIRQAQEGMEKEIEQSNDNQPLA